MNARGFAELSLLASERDRQRAENLAARDRLVLEAYERRAMKERARERVRLLRNGVDPDDGSMIDDAAGSTRIDAIFFSDRSLDEKRELLLKVYMHGGSTAADRYAVLRKLDALDRFSKRLDLDEAS